MRPIVPLLVLLLATAAFGQETLAPRTMDRTEDTIVITGKALGSKIRGVKKDSIRVYTCRKGLMIPIVFQIDERNKRGIYCYDRGPANRRIKDEDQGRVDDNDEMAVLARAVGDRAPQGALAQVPGSEVVQEVELTDPLNGKTGWIYVFSFPSAAPGRVAVDLADLKIRLKSEDEGAYYWRGEFFRFNNFRSPTNAVRATYASLAKPGTRDFTGGKNVLDSTQVRAVVSFMWVTVTRQSNEFKVKVGGYIDGPLRVIAENRIKIYLALGLWVSAPDSYVILWRNKVSMPTNARCPVNLDTSDESYYLLCVDMAAGAKGWKFYNSHNADPVIIDGRWSRGERNLDFTYPDWNVVYGKEGGMISKFVIPDFLRKKKDSRLVYIDDEFFKRPEGVEGLEYEKGAFGYNGYKMDMRGLKKGLYPGDYVVWYASPPFQPGDETKYLNEYDHPVTARATQIGVVPGEKTPTPGGEEPK